MPAIEAIGQIGGKRGYEQYYAGQRYRSKDSGQWCLGARFVVHSRAGERSGRGIARKETPDDIGESLPDEFLIAVNALFRLCCD